MSDTKFTKGSWHQSHRKGSDGMYNTEVYDQEGNTICQLAWYAIKEPNGVTSTNREHNANLIKASPKMYSALQSILDSPYTELQEEDFEMIEKVLAEARGEL